MNGGEITMDIKVDIDRWAVELFGLVTLVVFLLGIDYVLGNSVLDIVSALVGAF